MHRHITDGLSSNHSTAYATNQERLSTVSVLQTQGIMEESKHSECSQKISTLMHVS